MPLPRDRESLLGLIAEAQRTVDSTPDPVTADDTLQHAQALLRLGEIRFRLDEMAEAERLLDQAATAFLKVDGPLGGRDWSATARVRQAQVPMKDERFDDALAILDRAVQECGFPNSAALPELRSQLVGQWLFLLDQTKRYQRLYDAAGTAVDLFDEAGPERDRLTLLRALAYRADAARALGRGEEAVELYAKAIAQFKNVDPNLVGRQLIETTAKLTEAQSELGRVNESFTAFGQMASTVATTLPKLAKGRLRGPKRKSGD
jgi:tetratricopeptide (TPR) repeat protein